MSKTIKRFNYRITTMEKGGTIPFFPYVEIVVEHWFQPENGDAPSISANLTTENDIDLHIQELKDNLDVVGKAAKAKLRSAHTAQR